mmetsp:Transcript_26435/g.41320  ORF Transcript_26435/g.41320 Transcript_26435/m.41320 type:complete len:260 (+) Transcript_26435:91-870(+)
MADQDLTLSPIRRTLNHLAQQGLARPWTAKAKVKEGERGPASLLELCLDVIAKHLHTFPSMEMVPHHLMKEILDRRKNENMMDEDLPFFLGTTFEACPGDELDFISLKSCLKVTDEGFEMVFKHCPNLVALDLAFCELLSDRSMQVLRFSCTGLQSLNLTGCRNLTDEGCKSIAGLPELRRIELELCNKVSDIGVQAIVRSVGFQLEVLNLGDVRQMSNISVQIIGDHCKSLLSLSIAGNMQVNNRAVDPFGLTQAWTC